MNLFKSGSGGSTDTQTLTDTHRPTQTHTDAHRHTQTHTDTHRRTQTHTGSRFILFSLGKYTKNPCYTQAFSLTMRTEIMGKYSINIILFEVVLGRNQRALSV